ncbi:polysaccharide biosynthesis/export family protein [Terriglobus roseus]|uniref:Polysaccharide export outer membrane protein n=1 Tax=Terriglobus roseus TaxID=392734 RepID=A0A1H4JMS2_9BACT|nr:polysaccharide biosynthesis/export family protein [Terriglobus roseus]SEB47621.1 polysaccharide export outer membrane protein [Terriglobus roseus]
MKFFYSLPCISLSIAVGLATAQQVQPIVPSRSHDAAPTTAAPSPAIVPAAAGYRIGTEDALQVSVWKEPTLSGPLSVRPDGMISLPLVGDVEAAGKTPQELSDLIQDRLKKFIQDPLVTVVITAANSQKIYVLGEVLHVGQVPLTNGLSVLQAISASGGLSPYANAKKMYILRAEAGKQIKIPFDYRKILKGEGTPPQLLAGDTIVVP